MLAQGLWATGGRTPAATIYAAILDDIEAHSYDVFNRRAYVGRLGKLGALARAWWTM